MKLSMEQYKLYLDELAKAKKVEIGEIKNKLANCGAPGLTHGPGGVSFFLNLNIQINNRVEAC